MAWDDPGWDLMARDTASIIPLLTHRYGDWGSSYLLNIHVIGVFDADCRVSDGYWIVYFGHDDSIEISMGSLSKVLIGELRGRGLW
jgi:hypothetical protein